MKIHRLLARIVFITVEALELAFVGFVICSVSGLDGILILNIV